MMHKAEIDVHKHIFLRPAIEFAKRHSCKAIVVPPDLVLQAQISRGMARSNVKVIAAIDWPDGTHLMLDKFRGVPSESLGVDGFEILLTPATQSEMRKEARWLTSFFYDHFAPTVELRFVLGWKQPGRTDEQVEWSLAALQSARNPAFIRTTHLNKLSAADGGIESHNSIINTIRKLKPSAVILSGNINAQIYTKCNAERFACSMEQAVALQRELANINGQEEVEPAHAEKAEVESE